MPEVGSDPARLAQRLVQNDRDYFAAGARSRSIDRARIRWMEGLQHLAAGCVVEPNRAEASPGAWQDAAAAIGAGWLRLYASDAAWQRRADLGAAGFTATIELAMARSAAARPDDSKPPRGDAIRPVVTEADWALKHALAEATIDRPDGKPAAAEEWTALERRKAQAGYAGFWLVEMDGMVCGTFGLAPSRSLLRIKNIAVHPDFRRAGIGSMLVAFAIEEARRHRMRWIGAFAFPEGVGRMLYAKCGLEVVGSQTEWTRPLLTSSGAGRTAHTEAVPC